MLLSLKGAIAVLVLVFLRAPIILAHQKKVLSEFVSDKSINSLK